MSKGYSVKMNPAAFQLKFDRHLQGNLDRAAVYVWRYVVKSFNNFGTHGIQKKTRKGHSTKNKHHVPSSPGNPPNSKSGHLERNVGYSFVEGNAFVRRIGTGIGNKESVNYALALEKGTTTAGRGNNTTILPRPYMKPGVDNNRRAIRAFLTRPMR